MHQVPFSRLRRLSDKGTWVLTHALKEDLKRKVEWKKIEEMEKQERQEQKRQEKLFREATQHSPIGGLVEATFAARRESLRSCLTI